MSINRIITANDYSKDEGADGTVLGRLKRMQEQWRIKGQTIQMKFPAQGRPIFAEINQGAWIAQCDCGGAEYVSPQEPVFFCWCCLNRGNDGFARPVIFPDNREKIEAEVLKREVNDIRGVTDKDRAAQAQPLVIFVSDDGRQLPATRSWTHDETLDDLIQQNKLIKKAIKGKV